MASDHVYELVILGGGPAGLTAAVYAARKSLDTLLLTPEIGGQVNETASVENYMGYQYIEGPELMDKFEEQVRQFPIGQKIGHKVTGLSKVDSTFEVQTDQGESVRGKAVIIATGKRSRKLNVPGEDEFRGRGVTYCAICDAPVFRDKKVAVVGGGNSALEAVDDTIKICEHVYLISTTPLTGDEILVKKVKDAPNLTMFVEYEVLEIKGENMVTGIRIRSLKGKEEKELEVGGVFIEIGLEPNSEFARDLVRLNKAREIEVTPTCETGVPGLFAAGDVTNVPEKQIVVAAGEGSKAALQAHRYLQRLG